MWVVSQGVKTLLLIQHVPAEIKRKAPVTETGVLQAALTLLMG